VLRFASTSTLTRSTPSTSSIMRSRATEGVGGQLGVNTPPEPHRTPPNRIARFRGIPNPTQPHRTPPFTT
jgi:hypothetical protein